MMNSNRKKILVALDGSSHSFDAVNYLSHMLPRHDTSLVLFSVYSGRPERFRDIEESLFMDPKETGLEEWENQQKKAIGEFMENSRQVFLDRGFPPDAVILKIREKETGIARDIIREAQSGYDAVVAGRQGMNPITRLVIGSVAAKLIASLTDVPLWLVGSCATDAAKILVATDGSENALQAVKYVGRMMSGSDVPITLFQVIRGFDFRLPGPDAYFFKPPDGAAWPDESREAHTVRAAFEKAVVALQAAGIDPVRITTKIVSGVATRSGTIIAQAMTGGYGTIVIGRKGHSRVGDFHMGRVTNKVVQLAGKAVVWVVS
ncbi:universal stress protein [Desulfococcus sp.]|uniref:universal stress protein n=1 Tax=Desulfococcus sp. TaxID=2025834 RepID=UPI0035931B9D